MSRVQQLTYNGKQVFYMDFSGIKSENEIVALINECKTHIRSKTPKSVYSLTNIRDMHFSGSIKDHFSDFVKGNKDYIKASAVIGVDGLKQIVFNGLMKLTGRDLRSFNDKESALEWLVSF